MAQMLTCPKGHMWDARAGSYSQESGQSLHCPICGAQPETVVLEASGPQVDSVHARPTLAPAEAEAISVETLWPGMPGYEVLGVLGRGGMGVVYKARDLSLNRLVAIKMLLAGAHAGPGDLARIRTEAEAVASLQHPNIVQIYEIGEHEGRPYLALEYVNGGSLAQRLTGQPFDPRDAAQLVETLARAVHAAHQQGIVHRDLKPGNVLLAFSREPRASASADALAQGSRLNDASPKITDFGLAKRLDRAGAQTKTGTVMGTPAYMAPEQAGGKTKQIGPATDVYALGTIFYEMLTGKPPFVGETDLDTLIKVGAEEAVPPRRLQRRVPRDLEIICLKCLRKEPDKRYPSAQALADELRRFLNGEPIQTRPMGRLERFRRWIKPRREVAMMLVGAAATVCLLLLCAGLGNLSKPAKTQDVAKEPPKTAVAKQDVAEKLPPLPADLALVPQDALGFVTVRVGNLWRAKGIERLRERIFKDYPEQGLFIKKGLEEMEKLVGLGLPDLDRITLVVFGFANFESNEVVIVTTTKSFDLTRVQRLIGQPAETRSVDGKVYYVGSNREKNAIYVAGERLLVLGDARTGNATKNGAGRASPPAPKLPFAGMPSAPSLEEFLKRNSKRDVRAERGPLREALERAAKNHHVTAGFNPPTLLVSLASSQLRKEYSYLRPLFAARSATLTLDLESTVLPQENGDTLKIGLYLAFPDEAQTVAGREAAEKGLAIVKKEVRTGLDVWPQTKQAFKDFPSLWKAFSRLTNQLESAVRQAEVRLEGKQVYVGVNLVTDLAEMGTGMTRTVRELQDAAEKIGSANKIRQLAIAMQNYQTTYGLLPPAALYDKTGKPMHSWRVLMLPFMEHKALFKQFKLDEPWDSSHNKKLLGKMPKVFAPVTGNIAGNKTYYQVFVGPQAPFSDEAQPKDLRPFRLLPGVDNLYEAGPVVKIPGSFKDGTANTILIVEAAEPVLWTKPVDLPYRADAPLPRLGGQLKTGFHVAMASAAVKFVGRMVSEKSIRAAITPAGGELPGADWPK